MKKKLFLAIVTVVLICASVITALTLESHKQLKHDENGAKPTVGQVEEITVDTAKIKGGDAIDLIKSYDTAALGLTEDERKQCDFMVKGQGTRYNKDYYVEVIATVKSAKKNSDGTETYTFDNKGSYLIRYDGKQVLKKDMKTGEYSEMKLIEATTAKDAHSTTKAK